MTGNPVQRPGRLAAQWLDGGPRSAVDRLPASLPARDRPASAVAVAMTGLSAAVATSAARPQCGMTPNTRAPTREAGGGRNAVAVVMRPAMFRSSSAFAIAAGPITVFRPCSAANRSGAITARIRRDGKQRRIAGPDFQARLTVAPLPCGLGEVRRSLAGRSQARPIWDRP